MPVNEKETGRVGPFNSTLAVKTDKKVVPSYQTRVISILSNAMLHQSKEN